MFTRWRHNLDMAFPLLAVTVAMVAAIVASGATLSLLNVERPASAALAVIGDGVDEFSLRTAAVVEPVMRLAQEADTLTLLAIAATAISLLAVLLHLIQSLRSVGDVRGFIAYMFDRIRLVSYGRSWGTVRDATSGHPVPLARITLAAADGSVIATTVADMAGRYGFGFPHGRIVGSAVTLQISKGGYHDVHHADLFPLLAAATHVLDVPLDAAGPVVAPHHVSRIGAMLATAAFWLSVATVPLAASVAPNPLSFMLVAGLCATTVGRLCGLAIHFRS